LLNLWFRGDRETEPPLSLRPIEQSEYVADPAKAQRLRFEYWPGEAMDYLLELESRKDYIFSIDAQSDLTDSTLGPVDAGLARRVLGEEGLLTLLERLAERMEEENDRAALQWLVAITPETPSVEALLSLTQSNVPAHIRHLAATRLLESDYRATAIAVLDELVRNEPNEAGVSAAALSKVGETVQLERGLLRDTALLAEGDNAPEAIDVLLQTGDKAVALSAALHLLATHRPQFFYGPTEPMWMVVKSLLDNEQTKIVGLAAARWLALRPGYSQRIQACETLLEDGRIESTIPLLQYLAYECHGDTCQRACGHLLRLGEARLVAPL
ncbi:MAG: hypothetical protein GTO49_36950, partial [Anaerolineae bacterium]|nr:hypothetical protein [Anaerolineae bacterium]